MAKNQQQEKQRENKKTEHNGLDQNEETRDFKQEAQGEIKEMRQAMMDNPQLMGWTLIVAGALLLMHVFGVFALLNYIIGIIAVGLLAYGAWKIQLWSKIKSATDNIQGYIEGYTDNRKRKK